MSDDRCNVYEDRLASGSPFPDLPCPDGGASDPDKIERIRQVFRNVHFYPPTGSSGATWPAGDAILGSRAESFRLDSDEIVGILSTLPSLPLVVMDFLNASDSDDMPISELVGKIEMDQGLVARLLRVANSVFYGLPRKVSSVHDAIVVLGSGNVHNLILSVSLSGYVKGGMPVNEMHVSTFWKHSLAVAICAKALAPRIRCNGNSAFAAGLLHDIGRLVLVMHYPRHMDEVRHYQQHLDCPFYIAEQQVLGIDHARIGQLVSERWNFPEELCAAIQGHHDPEFIERTPLACVVHIADAMVHTLEMADNDRKQVPRIFAPCWQAASLSWADCQKVFTEVDLGLEDLAPFLGLQWAAQGMSNRRLVQS